MTACNLFLGERAAYLIADRGCYMEDGTIIGARCKPLLSPRLRMAITTAGRACAWAEGDQLRDPLQERLTDLFGAAVDQRAALAALPALFAAAHEELHEQEFEGAFIQGCIGLWADADDKPRGLVIGSPGHDFPGGLGPFELADVSGIASPAVDRSYWPEGEVTRESALRLVLEQRKTPGEDGIFRVGVAADLVTVDTTGVRLEEIHRWPDRIGKKIDPRPWWKRLATWPIPIRIGI